MKQNSRLGHWWKNIDELESFVGGLFDTRATFNWYRAGGGRYVCAVWVHDNSRDGGFSLGVDAEYLGGLGDDMSYRLSHAAQQRVLDQWGKTWADDETIAADLERWQDWNKYQNDGLRAATGRI